MNAQDQLSQQNTDLQMDRFIPARSAMDLDVANFNLLKENNNQGNAFEVTASPKVFEVLDGLLRDFTY